MGRRPRVRLLPTDLLLLLLLLLLLVLQLQQLVVVCLGMVDERVGTLRRRLGPRRWLRDLLLRRWLKLLLPRRRLLGLVLRLRLVVDLLLRSLLHLAQLTLPLVEGIVIGLVLAGQIVSLEI
jgi:hypothetical protein